jgi:large subunit ribosomal protein L4
VVVAFQANARQGTRAQKDREQVRHSTKKPFKQRDLVTCWYDIFPLWRGGGRIFPNMPDENFPEDQQEDVPRWYGFDLLFWRRPPVCG